MSSKRLFFALWPNPRQRDRLRDVIGPAVKLVEGRAIDRRNWHVTLSFIGAFPIERLAELREREAAIEVEPFRLVFDRIEFWARPKIACLCAATVPRELQALVDRLNGMLAELGIPVEERSYRPHITVARNARAFPTERLAQRAVTEWSGFDLVESVSGPGGVTYVPLKQ